MNKKYVYAITTAIVIAAISMAIYAAMPGDQTDMTSEEPVQTQGLPSTVDIAVLLPATGDLASHGQDNNLAVHLAADDFNDYLDEMNAGWSVNLIVEDTQTDPVIALEKIQSVNSKGIKLILGTETSAELNNVKSYADSNNMLLISPSSTSPKLSIDDNIFRLIPDDTKQGSVLAKLLVHDQIQVLVPIYRGDVWGDGLYASTRSSFESYGGIVDEGIRYSPEVTVFSSEASLLTNTLQRYLDDGYSQDEIAVLIIGFSEVAHLFNFADSYDVLKGVKWYGSDGSSNDDILTQDPKSASFADTVNFVSTQFSASTNEKFDHVNSYIVEQTGSAPNAYAYSSYDSMWLLGLAILQTQSMDADKIKEALGDVTSDYDGAIGRINFNEYGDLALADYDLWAIQGDEWYLYGHYYVSSDSFEFYDFDGNTI